METQLRTRGMVTDHDCMESFRNRLFLGWIGGFGTQHVTLDIVDGECLMISLFSVVSVSFLKGFYRTLAVLAALLTLLLWVGSNVGVQPSTRRAQHSILFDFEQAERTANRFVLSLKP